MNQQIFYIIAFIICMSAGANVFAQQTIIPADETSTPIDQPDSNEAQSVGVLDVVIGKLDTTHTTISSGLGLTASSIDSFFADDKVFEQTNHSYLRIALDMVSKEYAGTGFAGDLKLKVDLPRTKKRLRLLIETDSQRDSKENLDDLPTDVVQERDFFISLERQVGGERNWDIRPSLGIKAHRKLDLFARVRSYRDFGLNKWLLHASNNLAWFDSRGFGANGVLEFDRALTKTLLFRATAALNWQEEEMFRRFTQSLSIFQHIDERQSMAYQIAGFADDENDWQANQYYMRVRYRKGLYKKWVFGEIIPQHTFLKETSFHGEASITLRLELVFGESYR